MSETVQVTAATEGQAPDVTATTTEPTTTTTETTPTPKSYDEAYVKKLRDEAAAHRTKLKAFEDAEAAREKAAMSATERLQAELDEARTAAASAETRRREALGTAALTGAAAKLGVHADLAAKLISIEFDGDGNPTGVDEALAQLVKAHPYLSAGASAATGATNPPRAKSAEDQIDWGSKRRGGNAFRIA